MLNSRSILLATIFALLGCTQVAQSETLNVASGSIALTLEGPLAIESNRAAFRTTLVNNAREELCVDQVYDSTIMVIYIDPQTGNSYIPIDQVEGTTVILRRVVIPPDTTYIQEGFTQDIALYKYRDAQGTLHEYQLGLPMQAVASNILYPCMQFDNYREASIAGKSIIVRSELSPVFALE